MVKKYLSRDQYEIKDPGGSQIITSIKGEKVVDARIIAMSTGGGRGTRGPRTSDWLSVFKTAQGRYFFAEMNDVTGGPYIYKRSYDELKINIGALPKMYNKHVYSQSSITKDLFRR